jgi:hypothetical protein
MIFGGRALGMVGGQFVNAAGRHHNDLWTTVAQALLGTADPLPTFADEVFYQTSVSPISGLWAPPV